MGIQILNCLLTGYKFNPNDVKFDPSVSSIISYEYGPIGKAKIALAVYISFRNQNNFNHPELAGICRNAYEDGVESPLIDGEFINNEIKNFSIPKTIREKGIHFLKFIYKKGGKDLAKFDYNSNVDYTIAYAKDQGEFNEIIVTLEQRSLLQIRSKIPISGGRYMYKGIGLTDLGIAEVEKDLPKIPMIGLVDQQISTGDIETDKHIMQAKKLFFEQPQTIEKMRSACEVLAYVLEPLRKDCERFFGKKNISDFFLIVNNFDIRHNKETTLKLHLPEQLEWVFYSLLNTINTYTKLKDRGLTV